LAVGIEFEHVISPIEGQAGSGLAAGPDL
jgi:hypothetical protein